MRRGFKIAAAVLCVVAPAALSGCAETIYPRLPDLGAGTGGNLLTPQQQQEAIRDLSTEQARHGTEAAKTIEERN